MTTTKKSCVFEWLKCQIILSSSRKQIVKLRGATNFIQFMIIYLLFMKFQRTLHLNEH